MRRLIVLATIVAGCSNVEEPMPVFPSEGPREVDTGPPRTCGIVLGSECEPDGEITRCLCGSYEQQIGRFVCCRQGIAVDLGCQQAKIARDCDGNLAARVDAGASD